MIKTHEVEEQQDVMVQKSGAGCIYVAETENISLTL